MILFFYESTALACWESVTPPLARSPTRGKIAHRTHTRLSLGSPWPNRPCWGLQHMRRACKSIGLPINVLCTSSEPYEVPTRCCTHGHHKWVFLLSLSLVRNSWDELSAHFSPKYRPRGGEGAITGLAGQRVTGQSRTVTLPSCTAHRSTFNAPIAPVGVILALGATHDDKRH